MHSTRGFRSALLTLLLLPLGEGARAQSTPEWVPINGGASGTPATITLDARSSTSQQTVFDVAVHGFWKSTRVGADFQTYHVIEVPGLTSNNIVGDPDLPTARVNVAIATNPKSVSTATGLTTSLTFPGLNVWPRGTEEQEADFGETIPSSFVRNTSTYSLNTLYPTSTSKAALGHELAHTVQGRSVECHPLRWNPTTKVLTVYPTLRVTVFHSGTATTSPAMTKHRFAIAQVYYINWGEVDEFYPFETVVYNGDYLFVVGDGLSSAKIQPLVNQKKARGFHTTTVSLAGSHSCEAVRDIITNWYNETPPERDHYCLLVGDVDRIPLCVEPYNGWKTDDLYADVVPSGETGIFNTEVYLGRLSVDGDDDLHNQVSRILTYEDSLGFNESWLDSVVLIAHEQEAPGKYEGNMEEVRTYPYSQVDPSFKTVYGSNAANHNAQIDHAIEDHGVGIVSYRGHGSSTAIAEWNYWGEWWNTDNVASLNPGPRMLPVVWSFTCTNSNIEYGDCIAERWMESWDGDRPSVGAVAHYGATMVSGTEQNHTLNKMMWRAVFDEGLTTISHAIERAELTMRLTHSADQNAYLFMLLGDPEMQVRRTRPQFQVNAAWVVSHPSFVAPQCPTHGCCEGCPAPPIDILVLNTNGDPVPGVKVAYWKPAGDSLEIDESQDNRYTEADGWAHVPATYMSEGTIYFTVTDDFGNSYTGTIPVKDPDTAVVGDHDHGSPAGTATSLHAVPSVLRSRVVFRLDGAAGGERVTLYDLAGRAVRHLEVPAGEKSVAWDGRDTFDRIVANGTYVARAATGGRDLTTRVFVMH